MGGRAGVSPGLNNVIRSVFNELHYNYLVDRLFGIRHGFLGLTDAGEPLVPLTYDYIDNIHERGESIVSPLEERCGAWR